MVGPRSWADWVRSQARPHSPPPDPKAAKRPFCPGATVSSQNPDGLVGRPPANSGHCHLPPTTSRAQRWSLERLGWLLSVIRLPQSSACQRSLVEVRPTIPVCTLAGSVGLYVRLGLPGASNPWRSHATRRIPRGLMVVVQVPSREYAPTLRLDV